MSKLFISYRRDDTADICGRIDDKLAAHFGRTNVFKDVDSIPLGADFRTILRDMVNQCAIMLVVIGWRWVEVADDQGRRRLDNPSDFVRIEVETALGRGIPVIPVLVQGARVPREDQLPIGMAELAYRHGTDVRGDPHFHRDMDQMIDRLALLLQLAQPAAPSSARPESPTQPCTTSDFPQLPPERFPTRLARLGYDGRVLGGVEAILPPLCDVSAGAFLMGSDPAHDKDTRDLEKPQHWISLPRFQIAHYPVSVAEYACFVRAGHAGPSSQHNQLSWQQQRARPEHPVVNVAWHDAAAYAAWLAKLTGDPWRLPTEAEWEKVARWDDVARSARIYPWGDTFNETACNTSEGGKGTTTPVGGYRSGASPCGAKDMAGNVWEWTSSLYKPYPYSASDGREAPDSNRNRVMRGGSWYNGARDARAAFRRFNLPGYADFNLGFRVMRTIPSP